MSTPASAPGTSPPSSTPSGTPRPAPSRPARATARRLSRPRMRMRIGYLDLGSGASGDMLLPALLGAGWAEDGLHDVVARLGVPVRIAVSRVHRRGVPAVR